MPGAVEDCVKSVMEENPDYSESRAYAICHAQQNRGELDLGDDPSDDDLYRAAIKAQDDPCWDGYTMVGMKRGENGEPVPNCVPDEDVEDANLAAGEQTCAEGYRRVGDYCVKEADTPPSSFDMSAPRVLAHRELAGSIERVEQSDGTVRYTDIKILSEGVWTDSSSGEPTHYAPENLSVSEDNVVNIAHDDDNEVSAVGQIDAESAYVEDGDLYADIVLHMDNAASEYADENLTQTLETGGRKGFGGPSVEIPPEGLEISERGELGYPKTEAGTINGLGLVKNPASRPTSFDIQTANRQVALSASGGQTDKALVLEREGMTGRELMDAEEIREILNNYGFENLDDMSDEDVMEVAEDLHEDLMGELTPEEEDAEMGDYGDNEDEEDDDEDMDMEDGDAMDVMNEQIDDLWDAIDELKDEMMSEEAMSEELSEAKADLAAAETVAELEEARDELDRRLSHIEDQEKERKTLSDGAEGEDRDYSDADSGISYDPATGATSR